MRAGYLPIARSLAKTWRLLEHSYWSWDTATSSSIRRSSASTTYCRSTQHSIRNVSRAWCSSFATVPRSPRSLAPTQCHRTVTSHRFQTVWPVPSSWYSMSSTLVTECALGCHVCVVLSTTRSRSATISPPRRRSHSADHYSTRTRPTLRPPRADIAFVGESKSRPMTAPRLSWCTCSSRATFHSESRRFRPRSSIKAVYSKSMFARDTTALTLEMAPRNQRTMLEMPRMCSALRTLLDLLMHCWPMLVRTTTVVLLTPMAETWPSSSRPILTASPPHSAFPESRWHQDQAEIRDGTRARLDVMSKPARVVLVFFRTPTFSSKMMLESK